MFTKHLKIYCHADALEIERNMSRMHQLECECTVMYFQSYVHVANKMIGLLLCVGDLQARDTKISEMQSQLDQDQSRCMCV